MTIYAIWHGGSSYAYGDASDVETFPSKTAAAAALVERESSNGRAECWFSYAHRKPEGSYLPAVEGSSMTLYNADPFVDHDAEAYAVITLGPRGGVQHVQV